MRRVSDFGRDAASVSPGSCAAKVAAVGRRERNALKTLVSIQYLRALAALSVLMFHVFQWTWTPFQTGAVGVDVFFVISGFVMWTTSARAETSPAGFLARRAVRIAPPYWVATLLAAAIAVAAPRLLKEVHPTWDHLVASLLFLPHVDPVGGRFPLLPVGWTLIYEAVFYLLFAVALFAPSRLRLAALAALVGLWAAAGVVWRPVEPFIADPMVLEFLAGAGLGALYTTGRLPKRGAGGALVAWGLVALLVLQLCGYDADQWRFLAWGLPALAVVAGLVALETEDALPSLPGLKALGDASFSLYLFHPLVVGPAPRLIGAGHVAVWMPVTILGSIAVGLLGRQAVEKPLLNLLRGRAWPGEAAEPGGAANLAR
jgi:exopolysaccharide production protein ExoZ